MTKEVIFPEFIAESDEALVLVLPTLKDELSDLFAKFHNGEEISYWFSWELVMVDPDQFLIVLDIDWEEGTGIVVGFTPEMWEIFRTVTSKQHLLLMCDWELVMNGLAEDINSRDDFKPYTLLIRDVNQGLWKLLEQAEELEPDEQQKEIVDYLFEVLGKLYKQKYLLH
ncbi:hypothetical protein JOC37_002339 [Desulfohalotomaculum tongense]|uniref:hypothetical protein n=1 Tax=Desulforadius tongensis TaxID=1216062 RepID=UPI00195B7D48|nr:hypothetical protein [Desulforadius tongensis]MBM7855917.1 hypothetical protein [Desulforadius tongensis]